MNDRDPVADLVRLEWRAMRTEVVQMWDLGTSFSVCLCRDQISDVKNVMYYVVGEKRNTKGCTARG